MTKWPMYLSALEVYIKTDAFEMYVGDKDTMTPEEWQTARLIADAPALLAACKANQEMRQHILTCPKCADGALCDTFNELDQRADRLTRAAIAAAEATDA